MEPRDPIPEFESIDAQVPDAPASAAPWISLIAAAGAAVLGALVWAAISHFASFEIGWIAWGIGAAAGASCVALGGRTMVHAFACAAIALGGIAGGKLLALELDWRAARSEMLDEKEMRAALEERIEDARLWAELGEAPDYAAVRGYMIQRNWVEPGAVPDRAEAEEFQSATGPELLADHRDPPSLEEWRKESEAQLEALFPFQDRLNASLSAFDLLWVALGVGTAFALVAKAANEKLVAQRAAAVEERRAKRRARVG